MLEAAIPSPHPDPEATVAVQAAVIAELRAANAEQARLIATLQARVAELERRLGRDSSNSSKPPSSDGLGKPAPADRRADEQAGRRRPGKQPGAPGAHLAQVAIPDEVVEHLPERCGGCGAELADAPVVGVQARQVFDLPLLRLGVTEHRAQRRRCACGRTTAAAFPTHVRAAACYGPGMRALMAYLCAHQHLPVDRAAHRCDRSQNGGHYHVAHMAAISRRRPEEALDALRPWYCRPRTAAGGGRPQAGLEVVEKLLTSTTDQVRRASSGSDGSG